MRVVVKKLLFRSVDNNFSYLFYHTLLSNNALNSILYDIFMLGLEGKKRKETAIGVIGVKVTEVSNFFY